MRAIAHHPDIHAAAAAEVHLVPYLHGVGQVLLQLLHHLQVHSRLLGFRATGFRVWVCRALGLQGHGVGL